MKLVRVLVPVLLLLVCADARAHETGPAASPSGLPGMPRFSPLVAPGEVLSPATTSKVIDGREGSTFENGACTGAVKQSVPDGGTHDHLDPAQHRFACQIQQEAFLALDKELGARPDVVLGEMDIKADIAAVSVTYPEAGAVFFDVSDPVAPEFLSWYRDGECDGAIADINCGGFVDLSADGKTAFIATQNLSPLALTTSAASVSPVNIAGVITVDLRDPRKPVRSDIFPTRGLGGTHTARSHVIPGKGEFVFTNTIDQTGLLGASVEILRVVDGLRGKRLTRTGVIEMDEIHDTFIQNDPDGRTYLYIASGFASGFLVYDVSDPAAPVLKGEWDLTPQCAEDWYAHTIDVVHRGGRRFVTMPTEGFATAGEQSAADQAEGCGKLAGNGDAPGALWIVDATDFSRLGPAEPIGDDDEPALGAASRNALVATWTNPADRNAGALTFSPHNQQVVGDRIYLSGYHSGVIVLDAAAAFRGEKVRPKEVGLVLPSGDATRPIYEPRLDPLLGSFSNYPPVRPEIWDTYVYEGTIYAADMRGGFYAFREAPTVAEPGSSAGLAKGRPKIGLRVKRSRRTCRTSAFLSGTGRTSVARAAYSFSGRRGRIQPVRGRRTRTVVARVTFKNGMKQTLRLKVRPLKRCR